MSEINRLHNLSNIYGKLDSQDVEQFYAGYQLWQLQQSAVSLQAQIEDLRREIAANAKLMETVHPPAIAFATIARLQASGVNDIALLDRMLERGEEWLDRTMQRLDYCEQLDFIIDDYTQWCQNALEGAYDWIDSMREGGTSPLSQAPTSEVTGEATAELLLQKLTSEEDEQSSLPETAHPPSELSARQEPASALPELPINGEQSDTASVEARFIAPQGPGGETVTDFVTAPSEEEVSTSEEHTTTIENAQDTLETDSPSIPVPPGARLSTDTADVSAPQSPEKMDILETSSDFEETTPQPQEEQPSQLSQLSQVSQSVETNAVSEPPVETSPASDTSTEQAVEEDISSCHDTMINPAPMDSPPTELSPIPDSQTSTGEASQSEQPTSQVDREIDPAPERLPLLQSDIEADKLEDTEQGSTRDMMSQRHSNFLKRLAAKIWG